MKTFISKIESLKLTTIALNSIHKPFFFRISLSSDLEKLNELLSFPGIIVVDYIEDQLKELIKFKNPSLKFTSDELNIRVTEHIGNRSIYEYGVWVYYPWTNRLVHILDEKEFIDVRTSRNQYKITPEEKEILAQKKIGIIGLSVGQSVSVTIAMERVCGEIRLADFDLLELTNLNRIRTGVHNLGLAKVYSVAREISEIDPFLKVICYPEGLIESNMDDFFLKDGKLDLLIEESDGFDIKILSRYKAKELCIPVVMEASDRCTVDVERFDLEPNRSILHGLVDHLDIHKLKQLKTTEEKIPYMLDVLGIETSSLRLKASMLEIEQSINTWPQLASAVTMGGGIATDVSRRLLLNQFTDSGRYHIDIDELIGNKKDNSLTGNLTKGFSTVKKSLSIDQMNKIALDICIPLSDEHYNPTKKEIDKLIEAAITAPSQGNRQAWKWYYIKGNLFLFHDISLSSTLLDFENIDSYISFGAATENLVLKSHEIGLNPSVLIFPEKKDKRVVCQFIFLNKPLINPQQQFDYLATEIDLRITNRLISERKEISSTAIYELEKAVSSIDSLQLQTIDNFDKINDLANIISKVERLRMMDKNGHSDFVNEMRWTAKEARDKRDGIDFNLLNLNATAKAGYVVAKNWELIRLLRQWKKGSAFEKLSYKTLLGSSAIGIITTKDFSSNNYFNLGRSIQRTWLTSNKLNISFQPMTSMTSLFLRLSKGDGIGLDAEIKSDLEVLKNDFNKLLDIEANAESVFLFRLCIADKPKIKSLRKNIEDVLIHG